MEDDALFRAHLANMRSLDRAFAVAARECRAAIARGDQRVVDALTNTCGLLLGARLENRLYRLLYEPNGFNEQQRMRVLAGGSLDQAWLRIVDEAFAARRGLRPSQVPRQLGFTDAARRRILRDMIEHQLAPLITLRNILAHGQWSRALSLDKKEISSQRTRQLRVNRLWHLQIKANLVDHLVRLLHDLVVTKDAFERDFDRHWKDLESARRRLELDGYRRWEATLSEKYARRPKRDLA
jgi:hypothetical protein